MSSDPTTKSAACLKGQKALRDLVATNCNPYGQGTMDRVAWWSAFINEAQKVRDGYHCDICGSMHPIHLGHIWDGEKWLAVQKEQSFMNDTTDESLTPEAWEAWQATNRRLLAEGYELSTKVCLDGSVEWWATRGDGKFRRDPGWKEHP